MPFVESSPLKSLWYDPSEGTLRATFRATGRSYVYENVTAGEYEELMQADSKGAYFNRHIRDSHPFHET